MPMGVRPLGSLAGKESKGLNDRYSRWLRTCSEIYVPKQQHIRKYNEPEET